MQQEQHEKQVSANFEDLPEDVNMPQQNFDEYMLLQQMQVTQTPPNITNVRPNDKTKLNYQTSPQTILTPNNQNSNAIRIQQDNSANNDNLLEIQGLGNQIQASSPRSKILLQKNKDNKKNQILNSDLASTVPGNYLTIDRGSGTQVNVIDMNNASGQDNLQKRDTNALNTPTYYEQQLLMLSQNQIQTGVVDPNEVSNSVNKEHILMTPNNQRNQHTPNNQLARMQSIYDKKNSQQKKHKESQKLLNKNKSEQSLNSHIAILEQSLGRSKDKDFFQHEIYVQSLQNNAQNIAQNQRSSPVNQVINGVNTLYPPIYNSPKQLLGQSSSKHLQPGIDTLQEQQIQQQTNAIAQKSSLRTSKQSSTSRNHYVKLPSLMGGGAAGSTVQGQVNIQEYPPSNLMLQQQYHDTFTVMKERIYQHAAQTSRLIQNSQLGQNNLAERVSPQQNIYNTTYQQSQGQNQQNSPTNATTSNHQHGFGGTQKNMQKTIEWKLRQLKQHGEMQQTNKKKKQRLQKMKTNQLATLLMDKTATNDSILNSKESLLHVTSPQVTISKVQLSRKNILQQADQQKLQTGVIGKKKNVSISKHHIIITRENSSTLVQNKNKQSEIKILNSNKNSGNLNNYPNNNESSQKEMLLNNNQSNRDITHVTLNEQSKDSLLLPQQELSQEAQYQLQNQLHAQANATGNHHYDSNIGSQSQLIKGHIDQLNQPIHLRYANQYQLQYQQQHAGSFKNKKHSLPPQINTGFQSSFLENQSNNAQNQPQQYMLRGKQFSYLSPKADENTFLKKNFKNKRNTILGGLRTDQNSGDLLKNGTFSPIIGNHKTDMQEQQEASQQNSKINKNNIIADNNNFNQNQKLQINTNSEDEYSDDSYQEEQEGNMNKDPKHKSSKKAMQAILDQISELKNENTLKRTDYIQNKKSKQGHFTKQNKSGLNSEHQQTSDNQREVKFISKTPIVFDQDYSRNQQFSHQNHQQFQTVSNSPSQINGAHSSISKPSGSKFSVKQKAGTQFNSKSQIQHYKNAPGKQIHQNLNHHTITTANIHRHNNTPQKGVTIQEITVQEQPNVQFQHQQVDSTRNIMINRSQLSGLDQDLAQRHHMRASTQLMQMKSDFDHQDQNTLSNNGYNTREVTNDEGTTMQNTLQRFPMNVELNYQSQLLNNQQYPGEKNLQNYQNSSKQQSGMLSTNQAGIVSNQNKMKDIINIQKQFNLLMQSPSREKKKRDKSQQIKYKQYKNNIEHLNKTFSQIKNPLGSSNYQNNSGMIGVLHTQHHIPSMTNQNSQFPQMQISQIDLNTNNVQELNKASDFFNENRVRVIKKYQNQSKKRGYEKAQFLVSSPITKEIGGKGVSGPNAINHSAFNHKKNSTMIQQQNNLSTVLNVRDSLHGGQSTITQDPQDLLQEQQILLPVNTTSPTKAQQNNGKRRSPQIPQVAQFTSLSGNNGVGNEDLKEFRPFVSNVDKNLVKSQRQRAILVKKYQNDMNQVNQLYNMHDNRYTPKKEFQMNSSNLKPKNSNTIIQSQQPENYRSSAQEQKRKQVFMQKDKFQNYKNFGAIASDEVEEHVRLIHQQQKTMNKNIHRGQNSSVGQHVVKPVGVQLPHSVTIGAKHHSIDVNANGQQL